VLSALAHAAVAPTKKVGPPHFYEPNAALYFSTFIIVDFRALLRLYFCSVDNRGPAGSARARKIRNAAFAAG